MTHPSLSIIIITLNEEKHLPLLLEDLQNQTFQSFEVIHVDSNSDDRTLEISQDAAADFAHYKTVQMTTRGVSLGRNTGAEHAQCERLLFLDADTRLEPEFLENAMAELERRDLELGAVCMSAKGLPAIYKLGFAFFNMGIHATSHFFPTAIGACLFSTRSAHQAIKGFDEQLSLCEDCNYVLKAKRSGNHKLGVLKQKFLFDPRRLEQDGFMATGRVYLLANLRRFFIGELYKQEIPYKFGHYK